MGLGGCLGLGSEDFSWINSDSDSDSIYAVKSEYIDDVIKTRFKTKPGKTLSERRWKSAFSQDGHLDIEVVLRRVQRGGVHPSIRGVVWEFLLGCYDPNSTYSDRDELKQRRREQYGVWKNECQKMEPTIGSGRYLTRPVITEDGQPIEKPLSQVDDVHDPEEKTLSSSDDSSMFDEAVERTSPVNKIEVKWKHSLHQIGLDVVRTDRALVFYDSEANLAKLWDVLAIYSWIDKEIGYCQGMSDLCSPLIILLENEADAFWCFEHIMRRLRGNFKSTAQSLGVRSQLSILAKVIKSVDPSLHHHLEDLDGGEYLFAVRMLMAYFRREFSLLDAMYLWEMMWAMEYNPNLFTSYENSNTNTKKDTLLTGNDKIYGKFERTNLKMGYKEEECSLAVFLVASVLETKNKRFIRDAKGLDDVVKIVNDVTGKVDIKKACNEALKVQKKYLSKKTD